MTHKGTVTLETARLILRRFALDDADAMFRNWASDPEVARFMPYEPHENIEESRRIVASFTDTAPNNYKWAIVPKDFGEPIGTIGAETDDDLNSACLGYDIGGKWWGQGYMSEACAAVIAFFFEQVGANRVFATHDPRNPHSGAVMRKCGMLYEGTQRQARHRKGEYSDRVMYAILAEDYFREKSPLIGKTATVKTTVNETNTAKALSSGNLDVFSTPMMIALMERAGRDCLADILEDGQKSVGVRVNIEHTAASPLGAEITATATITAVDRRKVEFDVVAADNKGEIGRGTHTRFIVDGEKHVAKAMERI